jgi:hypothetical protein
MHGGAHSMIFLAFLILLTAIFAVLLFTVRINLSVHFNTDNDILTLTATWLNHLIKAEIEGKITQPVLVMYLFDKRIFKKRLQRRPGLSQRVHTEFENARATIYYGGNPFDVGIALGTISLISKYIMHAKVEQRPVFLSDHDFVKVDFNAKVNGGKTLYMMLLERLKNQKTTRRNYKWTKQSI